MCSLFATGAVAPFSAWPLLLFGLGALVWAAQLPRGWITGQNATSMVNAYRTEAASLKDEVHALRRERAHLRALVRWHARLAEHDERRRER